jgi:hypothetical protein
MPFNCIWAFCKSSREIFTRHIRIFTQKRTDLITRLGFLGGFPGGFENRYLKTVLDLLKDRLGQSILIKGLQDPLDS